MGDVKVYEPCEACGGNGYVHQQYAHTMTSGVVIGPRFVCKRCNGTGKGKIKEIRQEPTP